ncbi:MAG: hypothetical protein AAGD17_10890, partial [Bacteroidota bacterium]
QTPSKDVQHIVFGSSKIRVFQELLEQEKQIEPHLVDDTNLDAIQDLIHLQKTTILSVFPPLVKPKNNFGFTEKELNVLNLVLTKGNCILYLFGNPLFIHSLHLSKLNSYVMMYQDFVEFQEVAFAHFKGELIAEGKLPFQLKTDVHGE